MKLRAAQLLKFAGKFADREIFSTIVAKGGGAVAATETNSLYFAVHGQSYGPYSKDAALEAISSGKIPFSAYLYLDSRWVLLAQQPEFISRHPQFESAPTDEPTKANSKKALALAEPVVAAGSGGVSAETIWFVIRDKKKFGPYSAADLIGQLQRKQLTASAYVWRPGFQTWQKMSNVGEFSRDTMKRISTSSDSVDVLVKRKYLRAPYDVEVIAHDNTRAIEGHSMVIGEGGLFLSVPRPLHGVGSRLKIHFREGKTPAFNAVAEVVSVVHTDMPGYALKFVAISDSDRKRIAKLVKENK